MSVDYFLKVYRPRLGMLLGLATMAMDEEAALKVVEDWQYGRISYREALSILKSMPREPRYAGCGEEV